ncbi:MAG: hypothetical protein ACK5Q5_20805, partial [Planctomycetaceae bacterium]
RSFGTRWSRKVMPATLQRLMRHADIKTTMAFYVQQEADEIAAGLWREHQPAATTDDEAGPVAGDTATESPSLSSRTTAR